MASTLKTAEIVADAIELEVETDERLRERMNWDGSEPIERFLDDWHRASADRDYTPRSGDSSRAAGARFVDAITDHATRRTDQTFVVVAHGGVTTDALRTLIGDAALGATAPTLIADGVPCCAFTTLDWDGVSWHAESIAVTDHLESEIRHRPA